MAQSSSFKTLLASILKQRSQTPTVSLQNSLAHQGIQAPCQFAKVSPVEFTTMVFVHKDTLTMAQLSDAIAKMRDDVRAI